MDAYGAKRSLRRLNSEMLAKAAGDDGEYGRLAKAEIERRKRKRERKSA